MITDHVSFTTWTHWRKRGSPYFAELRRWDKTQDGYVVAKMEKVGTRAEAEALAKQWAIDYKVEYR